MATQTDIKSAHANATGLLVTGRVRLKSITFIGTAAAGTLSFADSLVGATPLLIQFDTSANATSLISTHILLPGEGILFQNGIFGTLTNIAATTICYG